MKNLNLFMNVKFLMNKKKPLSHLSLNSFERSSKRVFDFSNNCVEFENPIARRAILTIEKSEIREIIQNKSNSTKLKAIRHNFSKKNLIDFIKLNKINLFHTKSSSHKTIKRSSILPTNSTQPIYQKCQFSITFNNLKNYCVIILLKKIPFFLEGNFWKNQYLINVLEFYNKHKKNKKQLTNYTNLNFLINCKTFRLIAGSRICCVKRLINLKIAGNLIAHQFQFKILVSRPLLYLNRFDIKQLSEFWNLSIYPDKTNTKLKFRRNRIRKQLLPFLRFFFNRQIDQTLYQFTELTLTEKYYLDYLSIRLLNDYSNQNLQSQKPFNLFLIKKTKFTNKQFKKFFIYYIPFGIRKRIFRKILSI